MPTIYRAGQCLDHYQIVRQLGQGGASRVYLAKDLNCSQEVVLKVPNDEEIGGAAIFARHQLEARIGGLLKHPALQQHLNQGEERSRAYLVLEYMRGKTLRELMSAQKPALLPQEEVLQIMIRVCEALAYVHKQGVIHQDMKPDNIFVLETGEIKLFDFGIASLVQEKEGRFNFAPRVGTPDYMAPERLEGKHGSVRSDVYAVGITLYELLCGRTPFQETDGFTVISTHVSHDPPDILDFNPTLASVLATVVMCAVRRDPEKRYASITEFQYALSYLAEVKAKPYVPDTPLLGGRYRQAIGIALLTSLICGGIISFGILAQLLHHVAR